ncbi:winged helix-turn-helix transcriptional regulator [Sulfurisphaera javensis]|uniref:winged helix-turn-helix transcriptional regulator n=1 Tax=Sulfurisphaera javensis TaxID=2049879 RepID=UPI0034E840FC
MDKLDKLIFYYIFMNPRISKRELARRISIDISTLLYRINKLKHYIEGYYVYVNPTILGYKRAILIHNKENIKNESIRFTCIEGFSISEIYGNEVEKEIEMIDPIFYEKIPEEKYSLSFLDYEIIKLLNDNPLIDESEIAYKLNRKIRTIKRHLNFLLSHGIVRVIPKIDITKLDFLLYSFLSSIKPSKTIFNYPSLSIGFANNLEDIVKLTRFGKISIKSKYEVNNWLSQDQNFQAKLYLK